MNYRERLFTQLSNVGHAYRRYPLTMVLLLILAMVNSWNIINEFVSYEPIMLSLFVAVMLSLVVTHLNERFVREQMKQWMLFGLSLILALVYYFLLPPHDAYYFIAEIRTAVLVFTLFIGFIWIPSTRNAQIHFNRYFLAVFKYTFITILYGLILTLGIQAILSTVDYLFFRVSYEYFSHTANLIWTLFAPSYFLSLMPDVHKYSAENNEINDQKLINHTEAFEVTNFLRILISYIMIPLIGIYTLILLVYIGLNITGEFWTDNLLEPMLISYIIVVLLVYLLAANIDERITNFFRKVFPKILLVIVVFQTIASVLKIRERGITAGRYYVILFGVFAFVAAIVFSFWPKEKSGLIVPPFIVLAFISLIPPVDAFTVAKNSQKNLLEETLVKNEMLIQNEVMENNQIAQKDKERITTSVEYLADFNYLEEITYLPRNFEAYDDFERTFGFPMTYEGAGLNESTYQYATLDRSSMKVIDIRKHDYLIELFIENYEESAPIERIQIDSNYFVNIDTTQKYPIVLIEDEVGDRQMTLALEPLFEQAFSENRIDEVLMQEKMTLFAENEEMNVKILALELMHNKDVEEEFISAQLYLFIQFKE